MKKALDNILSAWDRWPSPATPRKVEEWLHKIVAPTIVAAREAKAVANFEVTLVEQRTRILSSHGHGQDVVTKEQKYWCVVLDPGRIAFDFGDAEPTLEVGDKLALVCC